MSLSEVRRRAVERILEDESLTADLKDEAAKTLLDWAVKHTETIATEETTLSQSEIGVRLAALRSTMKRISQRASSAPPETQVTRVRALLESIDRGADTDYALHIQNDEADDLAG